jgi:peptidoglycan/xylan/chitin deacetylase (PgdA/CDA1 family)
MMLVMFALMPAIPSFADTTSNTIVNAGVESSTITANQPDNWTRDSWGSNTATFNYLNSGHTGNHAVQTTLSNYSDGDAKWMFAPVGVKSGDQYTYSDWYQASVTTHLWAQYRHIDGTFSYQWLGSVGASPAWAQSTANLTIPNGVDAVSIFHVINANGQLAIDDTDLALTSICNISDANGLYNGNFEQTCSDNPNIPAAWQTETYGSSNASFAYTNSAHTGSHAVQTTTVDDSGEAGWQTSSHSVSGDKPYNLTFWHNGTTYVYAYVEVALMDGSLQYISLMSAPATQNTGWSQYTDSFITPSSAKSIKVTIATSGTGTFELDDAYLNSLASQNPVNFNKGVVSIDFDDGDASTYKNASPTLTKNNFRGTFYINASTLGTRGYMTKANVKTLANSGQEIGSHLYQHVDMVSLTASQLTQQITKNNTALNTILGTDYKITNFASPYGSYTSNSLSTVMQYFQSHRTTDGRFNTKTNLNVRQIHAILVSSTTTTDQVKAWVSQAQQQNQWLVLVYHSIGSSPAGGDGEGYATTPAHFNTEMSYLKSTGVSVMPTNEALDTLLSQQ